MESTVEKLVNQEPWRLNQGQPSGALDPIWEGIERPLCEGRVEFEVLPQRGHTGWWFCTACGYCGKGPTTGHTAVEQPMHYFLHSLLFYYRRRVVQGAQPKVAAQQALYIMGVALRYAAALPPSHLRSYAQNNLIFQ